MRRTETLIIGGGQAGLALSRCLTDRGREHVVLERGRVGERWRSERWDSLRLLTPNWMTRLPGHRYAGLEPDGFMRRDEVVGLLERYGASFAAPVETETTVLHAAPSADGWQVTTDRDRWRAANVVIATGHCDLPLVPAAAQGLAAAIHQVTPKSYRNPESLPAGGVLVVGASATGVQLADELLRAGRPVTVAVGGHNRLPRRYRGRDILWWLDRMGVLDRTLDELSDAAAARREPSLQLVGRSDAASLDLATLVRRGARLAGRLRAADGTRIRFADDLRRLAEEADDRLARMIARIDRSIASQGLDEAFPATPPPSRLVLADDGPRELDLAAAGITTVLWATGYRRHYPWLDAPVLDAGGELVHHRGRTPLPGLYVLGLQFLIRRRSSFIDGVGRDAEEIAAAIARATVRQPQCQAA